MLFWSGVLGAWSQQGAVEVRYTTHTVTAHAHTPLQYEINKSQPTSSACIILNTSPNSEFSPVPMTMPWGDDQTEALVGLHSEFNISTGSGWCQTSMNQSQPS